MPELNTLQEFSTQVKGRIFGASEGEIKVFKDKGVAKAYMWKSQERTWEEIGEVIDPSAANNNAEPAGSIQMGGTTKHYPGDNLFAAGQYDHVFDVEIGDGIMRKLPFNNGSSMIEASDKFCAREGLSRVNVEQIVQFLRTNAKSFKTRDYDGTEALKSEQASKYGPKASIIPFTQTVYFDQVKIEPPQKKILEFNNELNRLVDKDLVHFESCCKTLSQPQYYHSSSVGPASVDVIKRLLEFPNEKLFPCLDLYRIFLLHPNSSEGYSGSDGGAHYLSVLLGQLTDPNVPKANIMLALRCLCNLFKN